MQDAGGDPGASAVTPSRSGRPDQTRAHREPKERVPHLKAMRGTRFAGVAVTVIAAGTLGACAAPSDSPSTARLTGNSGVTGTATVDGGCPVVRPDRPCPDHPVTAVITVTRSGSTDVVARAGTDQQGHFYLPLDPGSYVLHPASGTNSVLPRAAVQRVTIPAGKFITVVIRFDSGVRGPVHD